MTGELGCSDIPGWGESDIQPKDKTASAIDKTGGKSGSSGSDRTLSQNLRRADSPLASDFQSTRSGRRSSFSNDGTDDHLHHRLSGSGVADTSSFEKRSESNQISPVAHADIQSLQESAEIAGKVVLLSRGGCGFFEKAKWVQRRGGTALIVGDDTRGGGLVTMYARGDTSNITIPSLFTSHTTAQLLSSLIPQSRENPGTNSGSKSFKARPSSAGKQSTTSTSAVPAPTASRDSIADVPSKSKAGAFHTLLSLLGLGSNDGGTWPLAEDSRRPPSSGNIDWVMLGSWEENDTLFDELKSSNDLGSSRSKTSSASRGSDKSRSKASSADGDGFVIGVQDWRDPDVNAPTSSSTISKPSNTLKPRSDGKTPSYAPTPLNGGSNTPGSGEYQSIEEASGKDPNAKIHSSMAAAASATPTSGKGWFARHFSWTEDELDSESSASDEQHYTGASEAQGSSLSQNLQGIKANEHEGLWVTLTPTSMSTSPFFDTILVLVVSPLLTLTAVYALLLIRSRIRRRRWRAPKSVVDRLPVRTYHTIATSSSSSSTNSARSASPGLALPTSPLLGSGGRSGRSRPRSQTMSGVVPDSAEPPKVESSKEKSGSGSTLWQRKYTGRQVECVVCLEEYVDGQSKVMSLPCGHEFHAECM